MFRKIKRNANMLASMLTFFVFFSFCVNVHADITNVTDLQLDGNDIYDSGGTKRLTVGSTNALVGNLTVSGTFQPTGATTMSTLATTGKAVIGGTFTVDSGSVTISTTGITKTLSVTGNTTLSSATVTNTLTLSTVTVSGTMGLRFIGIIDPAVSTPTATGILAIDSSFILYISTQAATASWQKIGTQS